MPTSTFAHFWNKNSQRSKILGVRQHLLFKKYAAHRMSLISPFVAQRKTFLRTVHTVAAVHTPSKLPVRQGCLFASSSTSVAPGQTQLWNMQQHIFNRGCNLIHQRRGRCIIPVLHVLIVQHRRSTVCAAGIRCSRPFRTTTAAAATGTAPSLKNKHFTGLIPKIRQQQSFF